MRWGSRSAHSVSLAISGGMVAEKSRVWRSFGHFFDDAAHVGHEAHVEHAVGFIEDEVLDGAERDRALFHEIEQSARRGDQHVGAGLELRFLAAIADAAVNNGGPQVAKARVVA